MKYVINKIKDNIRKYGFFMFLKRACIKISHIFCGKLLNMINKKKYSSQLDSILTEKQYKYVIVFYPFFDFNMPNFQRFQQMAIALGELEDVIFFYCTPNNIHDGTYGFKKLNKNLYLTNQYNLLINKAISNRIIYFVSTDMRSTLKDVEAAKSRNDKIIYDYVDEVHADIIGKLSDEILKKHDYILKDESIVILATAQKLLDDVLKVRNENVYLVTNGVRIEDFIKSDNNFSSEKLDKLMNFKKDKEVVIGYYGAFAKWFDFDLVKYIANNKKVGIVLIGMDYDKSLQNAKLNKYENILYLGTIAYKELKYYASEIDILTIPFLINDVTTATSPVKLFEYMALEKPIITTNLEECKKYESVCVAKTYSEFMDAIFDLKDKAINDENFKNMLKKEALENSWSSKAKSVIEILD